MKRPSWRMLKAGDLLSIPVDDSQFAIGQILIPGQELYLCVYQPLFQIGQVIPDLKGVEISLIARTSDELVWHGRWKVIGNQEIPEEFPRPYYVIATPNGLMLRTFDGVDVRAAKEQDLSIYGHQFSVSNIKFAKVMRHIHNVEEYPHEFSRITYGVAKERATL